MTLAPVSELAFDRSGPRGDTPVVLLHAGIADRRMWRAQWPRLTSAHDVLRLDLRGHGESTARPRRAWAPHLDVVSTLEALGVDHAHLVACSFGAGVAVEVALARPDLVASLLLCSPGGALIAQETAQLTDFIAEEEGALDRGDLDAAVEANLRWWVDGPGQAPDRVAPDVRAAVATMQRRVFEVTDGWDDADTLEVEPDPPAIERYAEIAAPVLLLGGDLDLDAVADASQRLAAGLPDVAVVSWAGVAHLPSMERPAEFTALLEEWLATWGTARA